VGLNRTGPVSLPPGGGGSRGRGRQIWVVVLIKDFQTAKQRLSPALDPGARRDLARRNAALALRAARAGDHVLAVCGSPEAASVAAVAGVEALLEENPAGQNPAARRGLAYAAERGAGAVLLLSSDLPLVGRRVIDRMLAAGRALRPPAALAAPATGRGGTNALYLCPPDAIGLHFGDDSLARFRLDAGARGVRFELFEAAELALDVDVPKDLELLRAK
jgi:2-phospho-L-lactate guanylyltransferase